VLAKLLVLRAFEGSGLPRVGTYKMGTAKCSSSNPVFVRSQCRREQWGTSVHDTSRSELCSFSVGIVLHWFC